LISAATQEIPRDEHDLSDAGCISALLRRFCAYGSGKSAAKKRLA
jgi:hypothetical protein